jgi:hypothetical protein
MKKLYLLACVGLLTACLAGCNRGWPGCFGRGQTYAPQAYQTYAPQAYETCDPCCESQGYGAYYVEPGSEWVPATTPITVESLPTPGPLTDDAKS